jgi:exonuclease VII small subunit
LDTQQIIADLEAERDRLDAAIAALRRGGRKAKKQRRGKRLPLSPAARKRISEGMKRKWAARKRAGAA